MARAEQKRAGRGAPAKRKAGRPPKEPQMKARDAWASQKGWAGIVAALSKKKAGGGFRGRGKAAGTGTPPNLADTFGLNRDERKTFRDALAVGSMADALVFVEQFAKDEKAESDSWLTKGRARALQLGALWSTGTADGGFITRSNLKQEQIAQQLGGHVQTMRLYARVFKRRDDVRDATSLYEEHKDDIAFSPRKKNGIDFDRECLRLLDASRKLAGKDDNKDWNEPTAAQVKAAALKLVPGGGRTSEAPPTTPKERELRLATLLAYTLAVLRNRDANTPLSEFDSVDELERAITATMYAKEEDALALYELVKGKSFASLSIQAANDALEPFAERLLAHKNAPVEQAQPQKKKAGRPKKSAVHVMPPVQPDTPTDTGGTEPTE